MNVLKGFDIDKYYPDVIVVEYLGCSNGKD